MNNLNMLQRLVLVIGIGALLFVLFAPPWTVATWGLGPYRVESLGHIPVWEQAPLSAPIETTYDRVTEIRRVNWFRFLIEIFGIVGLTLGLLWVFTDNHAPKNPGSR